MSLKTHFLTALAPIAFALPVMAEQQMQPVASALVDGQDGAIAGSVTLNDTASGSMLVTLNINGVPAGEHAVHLHETGDCSAADYKSAGGHIAGDSEHGVLSANGPHPGDMPNMTVGDDGVLKGEVFLSALEVDTMIMDDEGAAFIIHEGVDDYTSQPAGDAGARIACGVFQKEG